MAKYVKINKDEDIIDIDEKIIGEEHYCWNCEWFCAPAGCSNLYMDTEPFSYCDEWSKATEGYIKQSQEVINKCCKLNTLKKIKRCNAYLKECQTDINRYINDILKLTDFEYEKPELKPEFIKEMHEIEENDNITPHDKKIRND